MNFRFFLLLYLLVFSTYSSSQELQPITEKLIHTLDSISSRDVPQYAPGIATGVVLNGEIIYEYYTGYADLVDSILIEAKSRFNIASNGKQFTALAILKLVDQNKLDLEDDIRKFFPDHFVDIELPIKIKHLINHCSGIRDVYDLWSLQGYTWWEHTFDNSDALELLQNQNDLNFEPGSQYSYSNSNYILLAEIIEKVTGIAFIDYTSELFKALNMPNTSFISDHEIIEGPIAKPYFNFNNWFGYDWICNIHGDGNIFSTLKDQLEWEKIIQTRKSQILSRKLLYQSQTIISGTNIDNYGYGLKFQEYKGMPYAYHGGGNRSLEIFHYQIPRKKIIYCHPNQQRKDRSQGPNYDDGRCSYGNGS